MILAKLLFIGVGVLVVWYGYVGIKAPVNSRLSDLYDGFFGLQGILRRQFPGMFKVKMVFCVILGFVLIILGTISIFAPQIIESYLSRVIS